MPESGDESVLIHAPKRDGELTRSVLAEAGLCPRVCATAPELLRAIGEDTGVVILAEEVLNEAVVRQLSPVLESQPPWSDLPVLLVAATEHPSAGLMNAMRVFGNVSVLGRPMSLGTLVSAVQAALRARRRQFQVRDLLQERDREVRHKDEYLAMLAHELRNPLAPVTTAAHFLKLRTADDDSLTWAHDTIARQTRQMARLIDGLLDVARVTQGKVGLEFSRVELVPLLEQVAEQALRNCSPGGHEFTMTPPERPVAVNADPDRLEQILTNLLDNAVKFTPSGGRIALSATIDGDEVVLTVRDTGVGISPELLPKVFDLFVQIDAPIERTRGGLGIGLTLVKRLVEMHAGTITASSPGLGHGTEFVIRLPALPDEPAATDTPCADARATPAGLRVLIVDDNRDGAESLSLLLSIQGYSVQTAYDGVSGLAVAEQTRPDVVVCDIGMPGMDGYEVARRIRNRPELASLRLVALTGYGTESDRERAKSAGFDAHLVKPVDPVVLDRFLAPNGVS